MCEQIKGSIDIFMISGIKFDGSFPQDEFFIEGFHSYFRFDCDKTGEAAYCYISGKTF